MLPDFIGRETGNRRKKEEVTDMKEVLFYGDSNTWGLVPGSAPQTRFPWGVRWTSIVQEESKGQIHAIEEGLCGRTSVFEDGHRPGRRGLSTLPAVLGNQKTIECAVLMLGTNDCKSLYNASAESIGKGVELCLSELEKHLPSDRILLASPIYLGDDVWHDDKDPEFDQASVKRSHELKDVYRKIAKAHGSAFVAASDYVEPSHIDEEHLDEQGHAAFAGVILGKLREMRVIA